jgi:nucleoside-diphosphate-sugar epimerase
VLFISSTSVYNDVDAFVTEETIARPATESGKQLLETEQLLQSNINFKTTILRFGGLIGEDRHPVKFLAGRENLENPNAPINLIHQEDCIGI